MTCSFPGCPGDAPHLSPDRPDRHAAVVLARIAEGWRKCPDGHWRIPSDWPPLRYARLSQPYPPFSATTAGLQEQRLGDKIYGGARKRSQPHPPFSPNPLHASPRLEFEKYPGPAHSEIHDRQGRFLTELARLQRSFRAERQGNWTSPELADEPAPTGAEQ